MDKNQSNSSKRVTFTGGVRDLKSKEIKRFDNATDAYNDLYHDIHLKLNGSSSWVKPETKISDYISKFAPKEDNNDPKSYSNHMVDYFNKRLNSTSISLDSSLSQIKNALMQKGFDPEHEFTKAHLKIEDPSVLKYLNI